MTALGDHYSCDECGRDRTLPPYWSDETGTFLVCSPGCAERFADTSPR